MGIISITSKLLKITNTMAMYFRHSEFCLPALEFRRKQNTWGNTVHGVHYLIIL